MALPYSMGFWFKKTWYNSISPVLPQCVPQGIMILTKLNLHYLGMLLHIQIQLSWPICVWKESERIVTIHSYITKLTPIVALLPPKLKVWTKDQVQKLLPAASFCPTNYIKSTIVLFVISNCSSLREGNWNLVKNSFNYQYDIFVEYW